MNRLAPLLVAALLTLTACGGSASDKTPDSSKAPAKDIDVTIASIGGDKWPVGKSDLSLDGLPKAPAGFNDSLVKRLGGLLIAWSEKSALDPALFHAANSSDPRKAVKTVFPGPTAERFDEMILSSKRGVMSVANIVPNDVTLVGKPRLTSAWKVSKGVDTTSSLPIVKVVLQTRAAYEVKTRNGAHRVLGIVREQELDSAGPRTRDDYLVSQRWVAWGIETCTSYEQSRFVPVASGTSLKKTLAPFVQIMNSAEFKPLDVTGIECKPGEE